MGGAQSTATAESAGVQDKSTDVELAAAPQDTDKAPYTAVAQFNSEKNNPQDIIWSNITFRVGDKVILDNCYGNVPSGKVCAIMGPSGAGIIAAFKFTYFDHFKLAFLFHQGNRLC